MADSSCRPLLHHLFNPFSFIYRQKIVLIAHMNSSTSFWAIKGKSLGIS